MTATYSVSTFDVCVSGFERMRNQDEFILLASIGPETTAAELRAQWEADLQACGRPDDFDFDAARGAIAEYCAASIEPLFARRANPFDLERAAGKVLALASA